ncbi:MAG: PEP-CTERM sorting domain-containing protein [Phycisphaerales bacterium]
MPAFPFSYSLVGSCAAVVLCGVSASAAPTITNLGVLSEVPAPHYSYTGGISADGLVVVGSSSAADGARAFRWTAIGGMQNLGVLAGSNHSGAAAASADGSVIAGVSYVSGGLDRAFRWTSANGLQNLGVLGTGSASAANAINADGSTIAGFSYSLGISIPRAFRWTDATGMQSLGTIAGGTFSNGFGISGDGTIVTGVSNIAGGLTHAFRWTAGGGMQDLGVVVASANAQSEGLAISANGQVITGDSGDALDETFRAFRWTDATGMQDLGVLGDDLRSMAYGINNDGSAIVGTSSSATSDRAFLWSSSLCIVDLNSYFSMLGVDLTGWVLVEARGLSADGTAIAGYGRFNGEDRAWIVTGLPLRCNGDINHDGFVDDADFSLFVGAYNELLCSVTPVCCPADLNVDGLVDDADFSIFVVGYNELVCP